MPDIKQIPGLPAATEANDSDLLIKRDVASGTDERLSIDTLRSEAFGIPSGQTALHTGDGVAIDGDQWNFDEMPEVAGNPVVERGSNSDGRWVRFADGTQIIFVNAAIGNVSYDSDGVSSSFEGDHPAPFSSSDLLWRTAAVDVGSTRTFCHPVGITPRDTTWRVRLHNPEGSSDTGIIISFGAGGEWF